MKFVILQEIDIRVYFSLSETTEKSMKKHHLVSKNWVLK